MNEYSNRVVLHCDLNNFYASVECLLNPSIKDKAVIVCGDIDARHGVVLAKNQIAKKAGIKTGMVVWQARELVPELVCVKARFDKYLEYSRRVREIYAKYTDQIENFGIDESWLDVTHSQALFGNGETIANKIREEVKQKIGLTISVGVSFNKIFAKLGSDLKKPDAVTVINQQNFKDVVWPLSASELLYVGKATANKLARMGINTIGDLANASETMLVKQLGKWGTYLQIFAQGLDATPVSKMGEASVIKSVGNSTTAPRDLKTEQDVSLVFSVLADSVATRLREQNLKATVVSIWVRNNKLKSWSYQGTLSRPSFLANEFLEKAKQLFKKHEFNEPLRSLGLNVSGLVFCENLEREQLDFFTDEKKRAKSENIERAVDNIRKKYGHGAIITSNLLLDNELTFFNPKEDNTIHPYTFF